jgi:predicted signal transduction protein with EAL and GGDEF domain
LRENRDQIKKKSPSKYNDDIQAEDIRKAVNPLQGHPLLEKKTRKKEKEFSKLKQYDNLEDLNNDREFKENLKINYKSDDEREDEDED